MPEVDRPGFGGMLPPEPPINVACPPPYGNPKWKTALIILGSGLLSVAGGAFSNYLQTRGFVSVDAARVFLGVAWLAIATVIVIAVMALDVRQKALTIIAGLFVLTCGLGSFEVWATVSSKRSEPETVKQRFLPENKIGRFIETLEIGRGREIGLLHDGSFEARGFTKQIQDAFKAAGWSMAGDGERFPFTGTGTKMTLSGGKGLSDPAVIAIQAAFAIAGFDVQYKGGSENQPRMWLEF